MKQVNPYGRYAKPSDRNTMTARPAWLLFESPQWWSFAVTFWLTAQSPGTPAIVLFALWQGHYLYRGIVYPLRRNADRSEARRDGKEGVSSVRSRWSPKH